MKGGCLPVVYVGDVVTECVFLSGIIPVGPMVPYQQRVILFVVGCACLTRHSVVATSHSFNCQSVLLVGGIPFIIWNTDMKRIDRADRMTIDHDCWAGGGVGETLSLSKWINMTAVGTGLLACTSSKH